MFLILLLILLLRWSVWSHHIYLKGHFTYFLSCSMTNTAVIDRQSIVLISALNQLNECKNWSAGFFSPKQNEVNSDFLSSFDLKAHFSQQTDFYFSLIHLRSFSHVDFSWLWLIIVFSQTLTERSGEDQDPQQPSWSHDWQLMCAVWQDTPEFTCNQQVKRAVTFLCSS